MENIWTTYYRVNAVGDANCIYMVRTKCIEGCGWCPDCKRKSFMIDCGYQKEDDFSEKLKNQILDTDEFLLSHYHLDHYKGFSKIEDNSLSIEKVYYPFIPRMQNRYTLLRAMYFMSCLDGGELVGLIRRKNRIRNFKYEPVYMGQYIFDDKYAVIWPPKTLSKEVTILSSLQNGINKIENELNEQPEIRDVWVKFNRSKIDPRTLLFKNDYNDSFGFIQGSKINVEQYKETIYSIRGAIRNVTNRLSVCLYKKDEFLFLGDLEKEELLVCLQQLFVRNDKKCINVKYLITPHHGTKNHYAPEIYSYVKADNIISSNGDKRYNDFAQEYKFMGGQSHCTYENDDFCDSTDEEI